MGRFPLDRLPPIRVVRLPGRGTTVVREWPGPPGAPTVVLVHGLTLTADLNWSGVLPILGQHFRVIAFDQRGHGRGVNPVRSFRLEDCADDIVVLADALGAERFMVVGYSMGGLVAQLLWRRHPHLIDGLVLCSTARNFRGTPLENLMAMALPTVALLTSVTLPLSWLGAHALGATMLGHVRDAATREWAWAEMARTRLPTAVAAVSAVADFTSHDWIDGVDVPTAVVITTDDRLVAASRQRRLARAIPGAVVYEIAGGHGVFLNAPEQFAAAVSAACVAVTRAAADGRLAGLLPTGTDAPLSAAQTYPQPPAPGDGSAAIRPSAR